MKKLARYAKIIKRKWVGGVQLRLFLQILLVVVAVLMIGLIVLQPSKGDGLGSIGSGGQMFFAKNKGLEKIMDRATTWLAVLFGVLLIWVELLR